MNTGKPIKSFRLPLSPIVSCSSSRLHKSSQLSKTQSLICPHRKPMSISPSFRLSSPCIRHYFLHQINSPTLETLKVSSFASPAKLFFLKPITIQRIPTKTVFSSPPSSPSSTLQPIEELPPKLQEIVKLFQAVGEPRAKYEQLLFYGKNLKPLDAQFKTSENKVQGCVSQVWVKAYLDSDTNVVFEADSDSVLTKGLAALLVQGLSGRPVEEILRVSPDFAVLLGLQQSLTPSRNNGFLNMLKLMQKKALQLFIEAEQDGKLDNRFAQGPIKSSNLDVKSHGENGDTKSGLSSGKGSGDVELDSGNGYILGNRGMRIKQKLEAHLKPIELEVEDISYQHAGHAGTRGSDGETHFNLKVVSGEFEGKSLVKRHRMIYQLLQDELENGLHALSIVARTPSEVDSQ